MSFADVSSYFKSEYGKYTRLNFLAARMTIAVKVPGLGSSLRRRDFRESTRVGVIGENLELGSDHEEASF